MRGSEKHGYAEGGNLGRDWMPESGMTELANNFDLNPPLLVEDPKRFNRSGDGYKENVECRTRNIEYRSNESLRSFFFYQRMTTSTFM